jgi:hypothetical protein
MECVAYKAIRQSANRVNSSYFTGLCDWENIKRPQGLFGRGAYRVETLKEWLAENERCPDA